MDFVVHYSWLHFTKAALEQALRTLVHPTMSEVNVLDGVRDEYWSAWYSAYVLGRLGDFTSPSDLTHLMDSVPSDGDWFSSASCLIFDKFKP